MPVHKERGWERSLGLGLFELAGGMEVSGKVPGGQAKFAISPMADEGALCKTPLKAGRHPHDIHDRGAAERVACANSTSPAEKITWDLQIGQQTGPIWPCCPPPPHKKTTKLLVDAAGSFTAAARSTRPQDNKAAAIFPWGCPCQWFFEETRGIGWS